MFSHYVFYFSYPVLHYQTISNSRTSGAQNEDAAKEIASLKKQLEQAKKTQRDFGVFFLPSFTILLVVIFSCYAHSSHRHPQKTSVPEYRRIQQVGYRAECSYGTG